MLTETSYASPRDVNLQFDLINHGWDTMPGGNFLMTQSRFARSTLRCFEDIRVGARQEEKIDVFPAAQPGAPILFFVHGGWWRALTRKDWSFAAIGFVKRGYTVIITDYATCPKVGVPDISNATRAAVVWAYENADAINGNRERMFLCGHSAGGQQAAMMAVTRWADYGLPEEGVLKAVVPMSAVFDMRPFKSSWLQPFLNLTGDTARSESALLNIPARSTPPLLVTLGEEESLGFYDQANTFVAAWRAAGHQADLYPVPEADHGSQVFMLGDADSALCTEMAAVFARV